MRRWTKERGGAVFLIRDKWRERTKRKICFIKGIHLDIHIVSAQSNK